MRELLRVSELARETNALLFCCYCRFPSLVVSPSCSFISLPCLGTSFVAIPRPISAPARIHAVPLFDDIVTPALFSRACSRNLYGLLQSFHKSCREVLALKYGAFKEPIDSWDENSATDMSSVVLFPAHR